MPTLRQKRLAKAIVEDAKNKIGKTGGELLESVGYAKSVAEAKPGEILDQKGVKEALEEYGFTLEAADKVVVNILHRGREENRLKASDQMYKRLGGYAPDKHLNVNIDTEPSQEVKELTEKLNELYSK